MAFKERGFVRILSVAVLMLLQFKVAPITAVAYFIVPYNHPTRAVDILAGNEAHLTEDSMNQFYVRTPGLTGAAVTVSFESEYNPGHYLRHRGFFLYADAEENTALYKNDATFQPFDDMFHQGYTAYLAVNMANNYIQYTNSSRVRIWTIGDPTAPSDAASFRLLETRNDFSKSCSPGTGVAISLTEDDLNVLHGRPGDIFYISSEPVVNPNTLNPECRSTFANAAFSFNMTQCTSLIYGPSSDIMAFMFTIWNIKPVDLSSVVQRAVRYNIKFNCTFNATATVNSGRILPQIDEPGVILDSMTNEFDVSLQMYDSAAFSSALPTDSTVTVPNYLYGKIALLGVTTGVEYFVMEMTTCWATLTADPNGLPTYPIIDSHCAATDGNEAPETREVLRNFQAEYAAFRLQSFSWTNVSDLEQTLFVHCYASICQNMTGICVDPGCSRTRRSLSQDKGRRITFGPVRILQPDQCKKNNGMCSDGCEMVDGKAQCYCFDGRKFTDGEKICTDMNTESVNTGPLPSLMAIGSLVVVMAIILYYYRKLPQNITLYSSHHVY